MIDPADFSVLIASRGRARLLEEAVDAVLAGDRAPAEVVIVDQSAEANERLRAAAERDQRIVYRHLPGRGVSVARNAAARLATRPYLAFIDDDVLVTSDWLPRMAIAVSEAGDRSAVSGRVRPGAPEAPGAFVPSIVDADEPATYRYGGATGDVLFTGNAAIRASEFAEAGGFDERLGPGTRFPAAEDNDLGHRLLRAGWTIAYAPEAVVVHRAWRRAPSVVGVRFRYGRGQGGFYAKHLRVDRQAMTARFKRDVTRMSRRGLRRIAVEHRGWLGAADLAYVFGLVSGVLEWTVRGWR